MHLLSRQCDNTSAPFPRSTVLPINVLPSTVPTIEQCGVIYITVYIYIILLHHTIPYHTLPCCTPKHCTAPHRTTQHRTHLLFFHGRKGHKSVPERLVVRPPGHASREGSQLGDGPELLRKVLVPGEFAKVPHKERRVEHRVRQGDVFVANSPRDQLDEVGIPDFVLVEHGQSGGSSCSCSCRSGSSSSSSNSGGSSSSGGSGGSNAHARGSDGRNRNRNPPHRSYDPTRSHRKQGVAGWHQQAAMLQGNAAKQK
mmetsp:Transcript_22360/g.62220  ORF Transcript_22360/g.62220 Transcript_22360/m.62220 type:complete len:255 (+) Transcript_22360:161-925(+)